MTSIIKSHIFNGRLQNFTDINRQIAKSANSTFAAYAYCIDK